MDMLESYYNQMTSALEEWDKRDKIRHRKNRLRKVFGEKYPQLKAKHNSKSCELCGFVAFSYRDWLYHLEENHKWWLFFHRDVKRMVDWDLYKKTSRNFYNSFYPHKTWLGKVYS